MSLGEFNNYRIQCAFRPVIFGEFLPRAVVKVHDKDCASIDPIDDPDRPADHLAGDEVDVQLFADFRMRTSGMSELGDFSAQTQEILIRIHGRSCGDKGVDLVQIIQGAASDFDTKRSQADFLRF